MTDSLTPEEKAYLKFVQLKDEIKTLITNWINKSSETTQRQEDATTKMIAHYDDFAKIPEIAEKVIEEKMMQCASLTAEIAGDQLTESVQKKIDVIVNDKTTQLQAEINTMLSDLKIGISEEAYVLNFAKRALTKTGFLVTGAICLTSFLVAFGIHYLFPRTVIYKLNDSMAHAYFVGERILNNWSKLSDKEKDKILSLTIKDLDQS